MIAIIVIETQSQVRWRRALQRTSTMVSDIDQTVDDHARPDPEAVPLSTLPSGARATLWKRSLCCEDCELLNAMGMTDRCRLRVCRIGNPCIVQVASTRLGLSSAMASHIMVLPDHAEDRSNNNK